MMRHSLTGIGLLCAGSLLAEYAAAAPAVVAFAPPGAGQAGLGVGFDRAGALRAATCAAADCAIERGIELPFPAEMRPAIPSVQFSVVGIGAGRRAIVVSANEPKSGRAWTAVVGAQVSLG